MLTPNDADEIERLKAENSRLRAVRDAVLTHRDNKAFLNIDTWHACVARAEESLQDQSNE